MKAVKVSVLLGSSNCVQSKKKKILVSNENGDIYLWGWGMYFQSYQV